ncbi:MAG: GNAT family N-acetyltransferase [Pseudobdellovibrionaceae bacterium]
MKLSKDEGESNSGLTLNASAKNYLKLTAQTISLGHKAKTSTEHLDDKNCQACKFLSMKIINRNELCHKELKSHKTGEIYSYSHVVSEFFGSKQVFLTHDKIAPHKRSSSAHRHSYIEEIVFISKGNLTLKLGEKSQSVSEGSFIFFEPKDSELHFLINETDVEAETITFSISRENDTVIYDNSKLWKPPTLETSRLVLRPIELTDAESIFEYAKNPNVCKYTLWEAHQSVEDSLKYIQEYVFGYYSRGVPEPLGITLKEAPQKVIGTVGCFWTSKLSKSMELAYAIGEEYWGQGLVAEASQVLMDYCFKEFSVKRIQARCKTENSASARVMEKVGMTYEGTLKSAIFHRNKFWDMHYYAKVI